MTLAILKTSGKIPFWNDLLTYLTKGEAIMSIYCFIIFIRKLLGSVLLLVFITEITSFTSSWEVGVIIKVWLFGFFKTLEKWFLVGAIFFAIFWWYLWRNCWNVPWYVFDLYYFYHRELETKVDLFYFFFLI